MLMNIEEAAEVLGLTPKKIYHHCRTGVIPHIRLGRRVMFSSEQIDRWLETGGTPLPAPDSIECRGCRHVE